MTGAWTRAALVAAACIAGATGCKKKADDEPDPWTAPPVMSDAEQQRGRQACEAYVARLCACAESRPELAESCRLAQAQPEALAQLFGMLNGKEGALGQRELREAQHTARRIIKDCFEKDAALDPATCPRPPRR
ncbi:MAG: hypothetical protein D6689_05455 [Deltaproteobacteria bacterium]|nr:MAG: hypothetical protein D6689_05455 [Deltaproteobacteria bacterium]